MFKTSKDKSITLQSNSSPYKEIHEEMRIVKEQLDHAYTMFNLTDDTDLTDCYIYQINALCSRYGHLIKSAKKISSLNLDNFTHEKV